jgi:hypothetical protein
LPVLLSSIARVMMMTGWIVAGCATTSSTAAAMLASTAAAAATCLEVCVMVWGCSSGWRVQLRGGRWRWRWKVVATHDVARIIEAVVGV